MRDLLAATTQPQLEVVLETQPLEQAVEQLHHLQLQEKVSAAAAAGAAGGKHLPPAVITQSVKHVQSAFGDLLAMNPTALISPLGGGDREREAKMWDIFAAVYEQELQQLQKGSNKDLPKEKKRQILADILVWAEITQSHYDSNTASFVTEPHCGDDSFQRIGKLFKAAKQQRGLL